MSVETKQIEVEVQFGRPVKTYRGVLLSSSSVTGKLLVQIEIDGKSAIVDLPAWRVEAAEGHQIPKGRR